jgi:hypothetical protein
MVVSQQLLPGMGTSQAMHLLEMKIQCKCQIEGLPVTTEN